MTADTTDLSDHQVVSHQEGLTFGLGATDWLSLAAALRNHGAAGGCPWWRPAGYALLGRARCATAE
jgi:hypothetical protein